MLVPMERPSDAAGKLVLWMPGVSSVQVLSDWNEWGGYVAAGGIISPVTGRMEKVENGFWTFDISRLSSGVYRYVFLLNGHKWMRDPQNPEIADFQGRTVSIILITK